MLISYQSILQKYNIKPTGVFHIGMHHAEEAKDYYLNGVLRTIWIEANPECIKHGIAALAKYPDHIIFNDCLTDKDNDEVTFHFANNGQSSSILELGTHLQAHPEVFYTGKQTMKTKRVDTLIRDSNINIEDYPFVNIDIQGAEGLCLKGFGELLHKVKYLYLEVNDNELYKDCILYPEIKQYLSNFGFVMKEKVMSGNHGWGDSLFFNTNLV